MISHRHKCIFIHIPKCGGTSVEMYFFRHAEGWRYDTIPGLPEMRGMGLAEIINLYPEYFTFTFVRNPYDRFVSWYLHGLRVQKRKGRVSYRNFRECIELTADLMENLRPETKPAAKFGPHQNELRTLKYEVHHHQAQKNFLLDYHPDVYFGVRRVDSRPCSFIGRLENFDEDFRRVQKITRLPQQSASRYMSSQERKGRHYSEFYDPAAKRMVEELYAEDLDILGYEFEREGAVSAPPPLYDLQAVERLEQRSFPWKERWTFRYWVICALMRRQLQIFKYRLTLLKNNPRLAYRRFIRKLKRAFLRR